MQSSAAQAFCCCHLGGKTDTAFQHFLSAGVQKSAVFFILEGTLVLNYD